MRNSPFFVYKESKILKRSILILKKSKKRYKIPLKIFKKRYNAHY